MSIGDDSGRCIALFPGAFRPPHEAHLAAVRELAARADVDEVVVIVSSRARILPGTGRALGPETARAVWDIYLAGCARVRVEIAAHTAIRHAESYFERVTPRDRLLFCVGEADLAQGDARYKRIRELARARGVEARITPVHTGAIGVRATDLRTWLAQGETGREAFLGALPADLSAARRQAVWDACRSGLRPIHDLVADRLEPILDRHGLLAGNRLEVIRPGRADPAFRLVRPHAPPLLVKYAGDSIESADPEPGASPWPRPKTRRRIGAEKRALQRLAGRDLGGVQVPTVELFEKLTRTLVMTTVLAAGTSVAARLRLGRFDPGFARRVGAFLARLHALKPRPIWGDPESDLAHSRQMLAIATTRLAESATGELDAATRAGLARLAAASEAAVGHYFVHLDLVPEHIRVQGPEIGVVDFECSAARGDPALDLGILAGCYLHAALCRPAPDAVATLAALFDGYGRDAPAVRDRTAGQRTLGFAGTSLLRCALTEASGPAIAGHGARLVAGFDRARTPPLTALLELLTGTRGTRP